MAQWARCGRAGPLDALASAEGAMAALMAAAGRAGAEDGSLPASGRVGGRWVDSEEAEVLRDLAGATGVLALLGRVFAAESSAAEAALVGAGPSKRCCASRSCPGRAVGRTCRRRAGGGR